MSSFSSTTQQRRHAAWFEDKDVNDAHEKNPTWNEEFKHPSQIILPRDQLSNIKRSSPTGQSESDRSSPPDVFSPASSALSSASSAICVSSDSSSGITSPTPSSTSWSGSSTSGSSTSAPTSDYFLPRGITRNYRNPPNTLCEKPNPRRRVVSSSWSRPSLIRQEQRRQYLVEQLVDSATRLVALIWPTSNAPTTFPNKIISLRFHIRETLRRSRTSYSTLQVTLWYLVLIFPFAAATSSNDDQYTENEEDGTQPARPKGDGPASPLKCGRRMFLSALILASKYLQDRNFTARAWSKITGLPSKEISSNEKMFLDKIGWKLHFKEQDFKLWNAIFLSCTGPTRLGRNFQDNWPLVLRSVQEGLSLQEILSKLSLQRFMASSTSELSTYNELSALFTPTSSFSSPIEGSLINESSSSSGVSATKASPAISVSSDTSASSSFSCTEVKAPVTKYCEETMRRHAYSSQRDTVARQLITPSASFNSGCSDDDGYIGHPSQCSMNPHQFDENRKTVDPRLLVNNAYPSPVSLVSSQCSIDSQCGVRAPAAQQPSATPYCPLEESSSSFEQDRRCGLLQKSIAHATVRQPGKLCGRKRSASFVSLTSKRTALDGPGCYSPAKAICTNDTVNIQNPRLAC